LISALAWADTMIPQRNKPKNAVLRLRVDILIFETSNIAVKTLDRWKIENVPFRR
jgi:hypothetical protein